MKENELPGLVFRPQGERYNTLYPCKRSCRVSVHCWCWISHEGAGVFHRIEGHLDGLHYQHILQNVSVPSVWIFHPDDIIYLQQDHFSNHYSRENQEWLSRQADLEHFDWHRCDTSPVPVTGRSTAPRLLRLWVRIPPGAWMSVFCDCCVFRRLLLARVEPSGLRLLTIRTKCR